MQKLALFAVLALVAVAVRADPTGDALAYIEGLVGGYNNSAAEVKESFPAKRQLIPDNYNQVEKELVAVGTNTVHQALDEFIRRQCKDEAIIELETIKGSVSGWFGACVGLPTVMDAFDNQTKYLSQEIENSQITLCDGIKEVLNCQSPSVNELIICLDEATVDFVKGLKIENQNLQIIKHNLWTELNEVEQGFAICKENVQDVITDQIDHLRNLYCTV